ncbi:MAG: hypothetical protein K2I29_00125, partial [Clostridia bacterium]|nr:hypothetical protein [Clostridia bacterium]
NWEDDDGTKGTYKTDGNRIRLYVTLFGENEVLAEGTVEDGVLTIDLGGGAKEVYITETHEHKFGEWKTVNYNCIDDGLQTRVCACGVTEKQTLPAIGDHTYGEWQTINFNCITGGTQRRACVCGDYEEAPLEAIGSHTLENWTVTKAPDWSVYGEKTGFCTVCNETTTQPIDRLAEDFYSVVDYLDTTVKYTFSISVSGKIDVYHISGNLLRFRLSGMKYAIIFEPVNDKVYKYQLQDDQYYHKTYATEADFEGLVLQPLNILKELEIIDYDETEETYTVIFENKTFIMTMNINYIFIENDELRYVFDNFGKTTVSLPDKFDIKDETV